MTSGCESDRAVIVTERDVCVSFLVRAASIVALPTAEVSESSTQDVSAPSTVISQSQFESTLNDRVVANDGATSVGVLILSVGIGRSTSS